MANEFKDLKGKPLSPLPYEPKPTPDHLEEVEKPKKPGTTSYKISDYWNMLLAVFSDYALSKLDANHKSPLLIIRTILMIVGGLIVAFILTLWIKG